MHVRPVVRTFVLIAVAALLLSACATYDDTAAHARCEEPAWVKDLPAEAASRESRCKGSAEIWSSEPRDAGKQELDFGGKNKDN